MTPEEIDKEVEEFSVQLDAGSAAGITTTELGSLTWEHTETLFEVLEREGIDPDAPEMEETVNVYLNSMRESGINVDVEEEVLLFSKGIVYLLSAQHILMVQEECPDFPHVWGHMMRPSLTLAVVLHYLRKKFNAAA